MIQSLNYLLKKVILMIKNTLKFVRKIDGNIEISLYYYNKESSVSKDFEGYIAAQICELFTQTKTE